MGVGVFVLVCRLTYVFVVLHATGILLEVVVVSSHLQLPLEGRENLSFNTATIFPSEAFPPYRKGSKKSTPS